MMGTSDNPNDGFSHEDIEFLLREKGLSTSADLVSQLRDLEYEIKTGLMKPAEAYNQCIQFTRRTSSVITTQFAILETRIRAIESQLSSE
ncbi:hypothetical protein D9B85_00840 [Corynebacterium diphtheriae]|nr:hypothetical protein CDPW8_0149 [Corynebacterium diphtheriae PW8]AEX71151.1 hypothetical protein CDCE8392_0147 [Corynebacterium diphtheriae CDCE 8392]OFI55198.1 hypothetical protein BKD84_10895 [Corynebacterium diphtheriae]OWM37397.1 hypothetical protein AZF05_04430 [Corynebacterium diphtheriae bv. intermedius]OWN02385.1 hypothetical protein AY473_04830 [Corynebacterium diphtheriae bv. mitis]OWN40525.1 hypothetical protein AY488_07375 [Corynebacterium belfantii]